MRAPAVLLLLLFADFQGHSLMGQAKGPTAVFRPALGQIESQTRIPIMLPPRLPSFIREKAIKLAWGEVTKDGYYISLYYSDPGSDATYAAGFGGSTEIFNDLPNTRRVALQGSRTGIFRPVSCGGSCAPANLWWEENGVMYQVQITLSSASSETYQQKILVATANSMVILPRK